MTAEAPRAEPWPSWLLEMLEPMCSRARNHGCAPCPECGLESHVSNADGACAACGRTDLFVGGPS